MFLLGYITKHLESFRTIDLHYSVELFFFKYFKLYQRYFKIGNNLSFKTIVNTNYFHGSCLSCFYLNPRDAVNSTRNLPRSILFVTTH